MTDKLTDWANLIADREPRDDDERALRDIFHASNLTERKAVIAAVRRQAASQAVEEAAKFVDVCAEQYAEMARAIGDPNYWWPKNQVLIGVAQQLRERAKAKLLEKPQGRVE